MMRSNVVVVLRKLCYEHLREKEEEEIERGVRDMVLLPHKLTQQQQHVTHITHTSHLVECVHVAEVATWDHHPVRHLRV